MLVRLVGIHRMGTDGLVFNALYARVFVLYHGGLAGTWSSRLVRFGADAVCDTGLRQPPTGLDIHY